MIKKIVIQIIHNDVFHKHTNHIDIDCPFICYHVYIETLHLTYVSSLDQTAVILTKTHPLYAMGTEVGFNNFTMNLKEDVREIYMIT